MRRSLALLFSLGLLITLTAVQTRADLAPEPKPSPKAGKVVLHTSLVLEPDAKGYEARLQIGEDSLRELRAALDDAATSSNSHSIFKSSNQTILAGLSLFLALSFGGIWLARSTATRNQKTIAAVLITGAFLSAAAIVSRGNAGPPPAYRWRNLTQNLNEGKPTHGSVNIEVMPGDSGIKLIMPLQPKNRPGE
jgi:hypothetical protein